MFSDKNKIYRRAIWLYLFLLIFEGALRKWFLPSLSTPLVLARDPIIVWLVIVGFYKGWLNNGYIISMMTVSMLSLITTLLLGHQNLIVALYGWRVFFFYFPFIFVMRKILTPGDILKMGRFILYVSIPVTVLIVFQFYSPQTAWVNMGIGGDFDGAGFYGALEYFRPSGTFSFITGYTSFQLLVGCFLFYYLLVNENLAPGTQIKKWLLWVILGCYMLSVPYSISRTHFIQTSGILLFVLGAGFTVRKYQKRISGIVILGLIAIAAIFTFNLQGDSINAITARFEMAAGGNKGVEAFQTSIVDRYLGTAGRAFQRDDLPFFGLGLGIGSNAGDEISSRIKYKYFNADEEWSVILGENGILFGFIIILIKVLLSFSILKKSFLFIKLNNNVFPWIFSAGVLMTLPLGNAMGNNVTFYGCMILIVGFTICIIDNTTMDINARKIIKKL
jgi:hypothetical protein